MEKRLTQFSKLHERRAEVIAELYRLLVEMEHNLGTGFAFLTLDTPRDGAREVWRDRLAAILEYADAFWSYFRKHRIYLPESIAEKTEKFRLVYDRACTISVVIHGFPGEAESTDSDLSDEEYDQYLEDLSEVMAKVPQMKQDIEREFRKLLGA